MLAQSRGGLAHIRKKNASAGPGWGPGPKWDDSHPWSDGVNVSICDKLLIIQGCLTLYCRQQTNDCESILKTLPWTVAFHWSTVLFFNSQISDLYLFKDIAFINYKQCTICCGFLKLFIADSPQVRMTHLLSREWSGKFPRWTQFPPWQASMGPPRLEGGQWCQLTLLSTGNRLRELEGADEASGQTRVTRRCWFKCQLCKWRDGTIWGTKKIAHLINGNRS